MATRLISLTVGTKTPDEWFQTFQELSELTANLGVTHHYVTLSSIDPDEHEEDDLSHVCEALHHDDKTLDKVRQVMDAWGLAADGADGLINDLQNAGILFRERSKSEGE